MFRTLLRVAGYPYEFSWHGDVGDGAWPDIYYGPVRDGVNAHLAIASAGSFMNASMLEPSRISEQEAVPVLEFDEGRDVFRSAQCAGRQFSNDIILTSYWLLSGAREASYIRDQWDNYDLDGSFFLKGGLSSKPLVSIYGDFLRRYFERFGYVPRNPAWIASRSGVVFVLSHDVDYPQMIRWIECLRLLRQRGLKGLNSIAGVIRGTNHFWRFADWVAFAKEREARPAFYFMARQGSLIEYLAGTPDAFYDVRAREFQELFQLLRDEGCEIGLHASFNAFRDVKQLRREKDVLEEAAQVEVVGNRHHYWHLDPLEPHETLRRQEQAGFAYDSSLEFDFYPGFRRGICHPFRVFHPKERRELDLVELPPAWMDDHFDRRLKQNRIDDPVAYARQLVEVTRTTGGAVILDYHVRGMNRDFFPRYGAWLEEFLGTHLDCSVSFLSPSELVRMYREYEQKLEAHSRDLTTPNVSYQVEALAG